MKKKWNPLFFSLVCVIATMLTTGALRVDRVQTAENTIDVMQQLNAGSQAAGYGTAAPDPRIAVANGIKLFLSILGIIFVVLVVSAGFLIFTSGGNEEKVGQAKKIIIGSVIGLVLILSAYSITSFVTSRILAETTVVN